MDPQQSHLASLSIYPATAAQTLESRRRRHKIFGNNVTEKEYIQTDEKFSHYPYGRDGQINAWVLAPRDNPETLDFMSSCRILLRTAVVHRIQNSSSEAPTISSQLVPCCTIASVCTPLEYRGRGYARHLMRLLHWAFAPSSYLDPTTFPKEWGSPPDRAVAMNDVQFSVLYSDVGPDFYAACGPTPDEEGWAVRGVGNTVVWDVDSVDSQRLKAEPIHSSASWSWKWLSEHAVHDLLLQDDDFIINSNTPKRKLKTTKLQVSFSFLPSRIEAYQRDGQKGFTEKENPPTERWGISYSTDNDILAFASWFFELKSSSPRALNITRLRFPSDADEDKANSFTETQRSQILEDIFTRIFTVAKEHRIEKVEIWDVPEEILSLGVLQGWGGQVVEREKHLSAFKWYGEERNEDVEWMNNERFAWC